MIDFRYHLVSLISVFLALAVGVVLGAGPLQNSIGTALQDQVNQLRTDRDSVRTELQETQEDLAQNDAFLQAVTPNLVAGQLAERRVALVVAANATDADVTAVSDALGAAGAQLVGRVRLAESWTDPERLQFRTSLAGQLIGYLSPPPPADAGADGVLGAALAQGLTRADPADPAALAPEATEILALLTEGETPIATVDQAPTLAAQDIVVVGPRADSARGAAPQASAEPTASAAVVERREAAAETAVATVRGMGQHAEGVVVLGAAAAEEDLVAAIRADEDAAEAVSTVDGVGSTPSVSTTVLGLRQDATGSSGHYGFAESAQALVPVTQQ